ncbi:MAG TPA: HNH endonuclease signature motif containing protein [Kofleriaceae bacterium]|nr:HNH endonuclease signature motif containing protein [Kofleriaceae bacterium]
MHRDRGACRFPGCTNRLYLEGHHIEHWAQGGNTSLDNACLFCSRHHVFVHEYKYRVELVDGEVHVFDPQGRRIHQEAPRLAPSSVVAWEHMKEQNAALDITSATNTPRWNGLPVQYDLVMNGLARREGLGGRESGGRLVGLAS